MVVANKGSRAATALRNGGALQLLVVISPRLRLFTHHPKQHAACFHTVLTVRAVKEFLTVTGTQSTGTVAPAAQIQIL